ncbi:MAG: hypothetical protein ABI977_21335 [Acidobacteriota bacterium]
MPVKYASALLSFALLLVFVAAATSTVSGQSKSRELIIGGEDMSHKADGMEVKVLKYSGNNQWDIVGQDEVFRKGDKVKIELWANTSGHIYFVNIAPSRKIKVLHHKIIEKEKDYTLPESSYLGFNQEQGVEILKIYLSPNPIQVFEDAMKNNNGVLGNNATSASKELGDKEPAKGQKLVGIPQENDCPALKCKSRGIDFAGPDPNKGKGAVAVARQDGKTGKDGNRLAKDDAIILEIRLIHK